MKRIPASMMFALGLILIAWEGTELFARANHSIFVWAGFVAGFLLVLAAVFAWRDGRRRRNSR